MTTFSKETLIPKYETKNISDFISHTIFANISSKSIFIYTLVVIACLFYFRHIHISPNYIVGIGVSIVIIIILYKYEIDTFQNNEKLHETKTSYIYPSSEKISRYRDLTDLVFSIQDFYEYNPQSFENMLNSLETFLTIYENILDDTSLSGELYKNADNHKLLTLNYLHSIIIAIPSDKILIEKLNTSMKNMENILNDYLTKIYDIHKQYIDEHGYYNNTKLIELNMYPYNHYDSKLLTQYY